MCLFVATPYLLESDSPKKNHVAPTLMAFPKTLKTSQALKRGGEGPLTGLYPLYTVYSVLSRELLILYILYCVLHDVQF